MKTKILFLVCLFIGIFVIPIQAQDQANNASQGWWHTSSSGAFSVWCDGEVVDVLKGELRMHFVNKWFDNGHLRMRQIKQIKGEFTSTTDGEVFRMNTTRKIETGADGKRTGIIHYNAKGDRGTMYSGKIFLDRSSGSAIFTEIHANCH